MVTILQSPFFVELILPFLLVFAVAFAVLQKSEVLGKGKKQVDAIVSFVIALIFIAFGNAIGIILQLTAFMGVLLIILIVVMVLMGALKNEGDKDNKIDKTVKGVLGIGAVIAVAVFLLLITGAWDYLYEKALFGGDELMTNIMFIIIVIVAIAIVVGGKGKKKEEKES